MQYRVQIDNLRSNQVNGKKLIELSNGEDWYVFLGRCNIKSGPAHTILKEFIKKKQSVANQGQIQTFSITNDGNFLKMQQQPILGANADQNKHQAKQYQNMRQNSTPPQQNSLGNNTVDSINLDSIAWSQDSYESKAFIDTDTNILVININEYKEEPIPLKVVCTADVNAETFKKQYSIERRSINKKDVNQGFLPHKLIDGKIEFNRTSERRFLGVIKVENNNELSKAKEEANKNRSKTEKVCIALEIGGKSLEFKLLSKSSFEERKKQNRFEKYTQLKQIAPNCGPVGTPVDFQLIMPEDLQNIFSPKINSIKASFKTAGSEIENKFTNISPSEKSIIIAKTKVPKKFNDGDVLQVAVKPLKQNSDNITFRVTNTASSLSSQSNGSGDNGKKRSHDTNNDEDEDGDRRGRKRSKPNNDADTSNRSIPAEAAAMLFGLDNIDMFDLTDLTFEMCMKLQEALFPESLLSEEIPEDLEVILNKVSNEALCEQLVRILGDMRDTTDEFGHTVLFPISCVHVDLGNASQRQLNIIRTIIQSKKLAVDHQDNYKCNVLHWGLSSGSWSAVSAIIESLQFSNSTVLEDMMLAKNYDQETPVQFMLRTNKPNDLKKWIDDVETLPPTISNMIHMFLFPDYEDNDQDVEIKSGLKDLITQENDTFTIRDEKAITMLPPFLVEIDCPTSIVEKEHNYYLSCAILDEPKAYRSLSKCIRANETEQAKTERVKFTTVVSDFDLTRIRAKFFAKERSYTVQVMYELIEQAEKHVRKVWCSWSEELFNLVLRK
jgi:hypothetical protein